MLAAERKHLCVFSGFVAEPDCMLSNLAIELLRRVAYSDMYEVLPQL